MQFIVEFELLLAPQRPARLQKETGSVMKFDSTRRPVKASNGQQYQAAISGFTLLLCGSLLLGSGQIAQAAHNHPTLREFRAEHDHLNHRESRRLFRTFYNGRSTGGAELPGPGPILPVDPPSTNGTTWREVIFNGSPMSRREAKLLRVGAQDNGTSLVRLSTGVDLDLSSADRNIVLGANLFKDTSSVEIMVGSEKQTFSAGSKATAAEYVAIKQALATNAGQKLVIDQSGVASGGAVDLSEITGNNNPLRASSLTVSSGVTAYGDFGRRSDFSLEGDLNNYGTVVALSSRRSVRDGAIRAEDITNNAGATITSVIPESLANTRLASRVDLTLDARGEFKNYGTLSSSGDLSIVAGGSIENKGTVSASDSVNMTASTVNNSSTITALNGNINIDGPATADLNVNNSGGTLSAVKGAINVRTPGYEGTFNNNLNGGDLLSREVNLYGGKATNYVNVNELTGTLSQTGLASHVRTSTDALILGSTCLTGDPTFFNNGDIFITGDLIVAEALTIIAEGTISTDPGVTVAARSATQGFDITMIAGASITSPTGGDLTLPTVNPGSIVTIDGTASVTGGSILFAPGTIISTSPTAGGTGAGGNVSLFAFQVGTAFGRVDINSGTINTGGVGAAANGNILIVGGGSDPGVGTAFQIGALNTTGGTGGGGNLTITTAQPVASAGNITYGADGKLTSASFLQAGAALNPNASIGQAGGQARIAGNAIFTAGKDIAQDNSKVNSSLFTDNFNSQVTLNAGGNIGAGFQFPFIIEGFNGKITKKVLNAHGGSSGNNVLTVEAGGSATIQRNATTDLGLATSSAVNGMTVRTNSIFRIVGNQTSTAGEVTLSTTGGALFVNPGVAVTAFDLIDIINGSKKKPTLTVGANSTFTTTATGTGQFGPGQIFFTNDRKALSLKAATFTSSGTQSFGPPRINIGSEPISSLGNSNLAGDGITPEFALYAGKPPSGDIGPPNTFTSNFVQILLTNTGKKGALSFGGGVQVTAGQ